VPALDSITTTLSGLAADAPQAVQLWKDASKFVVQDFAYGAVLYFGSTPYVRDERFVEIGYRLNSLGQYTLDYTKVSLKG
jgi:hypothetical protein